VGRDWANLNWQWRIKGFAPLQDQPKIDGKGEPLTILDLEQTQLVRLENSREGMLVRALRELVK
jgi:hypothetical protein